jgi:hypothetical protein
VAIELGKRLHAEALLNDDHIEAATSGKGVGPARVIRPQLAAVVRQVRRVGQPGDTSPRHRLHVNSPSFGVRSDDRTAAV